MKVVKLLSVFLSLGLLVSACQAATPAAEPPPPAAATSPATTTPPIEPALKPSVPSAPEIPEGFNIGDRAIDFELQTLDGQTVKLSNLRGKIVLLNFWATWCGPCKFEMPFLQKAHENWSDKGLVVLAVDLIGSTPTETVDTVNKFMAELELSMMVPLDEGLKVAKAYKVTAIPSSYIIDKDGIIRQRIIGAFPNYEAIETELKKFIP